MEAVLRELQTLYLGLLWPFVRIAATLASAPVLGEMMMPLRARLLVALILAVAVQPALPDLPAISPFSLLGVMTVFEQVMLGGLIGLVFHLVLSVMLLFGALASSQMGLSMAALNDPMNGTSSDAISALMYVVFVLLFFSSGGHLVLTQVLARSFHVWPVGSFWFDAAALLRLALGVGWIFAAALMLALPLAFAALAVQLGAGMLNRVAPPLNLFALGFSITIMFGLLLVSLLVPSLPDHFMRMLTHVVGLLDSLAPAPPVTP